MGGTFGYEGRYKERTILMKKHRMIRRVEDNINVDVTKTISENGTWIEPAQDHGQRPCSTLEFCYTSVHQGSEYNFHVLRITVKEYCMLNDVRHSGHIIEG